MSKKNHSGKALICISKIVNFRVKFMKKCVFLHDDKI